MLDLCLMQAISNISFRGVRQTETFQIVSKKVSN